MTPSSHQSLLNVGTAGSELAELAARFGQVQSQLNLLAEVAKLMTACPHLNIDQESYIDRIQERITTRLLDEMRHISEQASRIPARTDDEFAAKGQIWLGRMIPEPGNDILMLAESICRDLSIPPRRPACVMREARRGAGDSAR